ncbi:MAG TPA: threonine synthase, partial [Candidatus Rothia avistercoris]|nr:threonine synthase [Candidatus Rothia avistercoris]
RDANERLGVLLDPHTADGVKVARDWAEKVDTPIICLETALPVKFAETIKEATGSEPAIPKRFAGIMDADRHVIDLPNEVEAVKELIEKNV